MGKRRPTVVPVDRILENMEQTWSEGNLLPRNKAVVQINNLELIEYLWGT